MMSYRLGARVILVRYPKNRRNVARNYKRFRQGFREQYFAKGVLCGVTSCDDVDRWEHSDGPAMCVMMFMASKRTPTVTEFTCTPSVIRWSVLMFLLSMNPQCLRVVIDFSSSLESSTFLRSDSDWYFRCMMEEMVTGVG